MPSVNDAILIYFCATFNRGVSIDFVDLYRFFVISDRELLKDTLHVLSLRLCFHICRFSLISCLLSLSTRHYIRFNYTNIWWEWATWPCARWAVDNHSSTHSQSPKPSNNSKNFCPAKWVDIVFQHLLNNIITVP